MRNEHAHTLHCTDKEAIDDTYESYGIRKSECENVLIQSGLIYGILRPALVYGKYDNTDRFYYWLYQIQKEQTLLVPNNGKNLFSITYVTDLVQSIILNLNETFNSAIFNITSHPQTSIAKIIQSKSKLLPKTKKMVNVNSEFLHQNKIAEWIYHYGSIAIIILLTTSKLKTN
jgi:nucleoside-diphosphate-sugar epimerase